MGELSITELLEAYGAWVSDDNSGLDCKSPSLMLIKSAPELCKRDVLQAHRATAAFISDDDALAVDRAMNALMRHSVHLHNIVAYRFIYGWSERRIAKDYWSDFEYPKCNKQATVYHIKPLLWEGIGFIGGQMAKVMPNPA